MKHCAICNATGHLILTRQGLRCGTCLRGEAEEMRHRMEAYREIVADLAASEPTLRPRGCALGCRGKVLVDPPDRSNVGLYVHAESCPWRRAVEITKP
jgi:hypothetical protein